MSERWVPAKGFEGFYEVSDLGRVRGVPRQIIRNGKIKTYHGGILNAYWHHRHLKVTLYGHNKRERQVFVHVLVLESFVGPRPKGYLGCHKDDNPLNNTLANLRWDSPTANSLDAVRNGVHPETKRTKCDQGHPLNGRNRKGRYCLICNRAKQRKAKAQKKLLEAQSPGSGVVIKKGKR